MATPALAFAQLANDCEADGLSAENANRIAEELSKTFNVHTDEVAILRLEKTNLRFVYPSKLGNVGSIPLNTTTSVAALANSWERPRRSLPTIAAKFWPALKPKTSRAPGKLSHAIRCE